MNLLLAILLLTPQAWVAENVPGAAGYLFCWSYNASKFFDCQCAVVQDPDEPYMPEDEVFSLWSDRPGAVVFFHFVTIWPDGSYGSHHGPIEPCPVEVCR